MTDSLGGPVPDEGEPTWLRAALQEEAARHEPDSARMLARVETLTGPLEHQTPEVGPSPVRAPGVSRDRDRGSSRGWSLERARERGRRGGWRSAAVPALAVVAIASIAWWVGVAGPAGDPVAVPPLTSDGTASADLPAPGADGHSASPRAGTVATAVPDPAQSRGTAKPAQDSASPVPTSGVRAQAGLDPHSNPYWAQNNLTLTFDRQVRTLAVTVRVARTPGVTSTGTWVSLPADDFTVSVKEEPGALVYRYALKAARVIRPGTYTFAVQYNRPQTDAGGRDDSYLVQLSGDRLTGHY